MPERSTVTMYVNGQIAVVPAGSVVSVAMLASGNPCRTSVSGVPRTALCGMGICFECRAVVDGVAHQRTCQMLCREGMKVETQR
jgi:D-hydroxyproline dehydrogenase subunit gamma